MKPIVMLLLVFFVGSTIVSCSKRSSLTHGKNKLDDKTKKYWKWNAY